MEEVRGMLKENLNIWYIKNSGKDCFKSLYTTYIFHNISELGKTMSFFLANSLKTFLGSTCLLEDLITRGRDRNVFFEDLKHQDIHTYCIYVFYINGDDIYVLNEYTLKDFDLNELIDNRGVKYYMSIEIPLDENNNIIKDTEE